MRFVLAVAAGLAAAALACASAPAAKDDARGGVGSDDDVLVDPYLDPPNPFEPNSEEDAGAFSVPEHPRAQSDAGAAVDGGPVVADAGTEPGEPDAGPPPRCGPIATGSLQIVELLIKSIDGAGDTAEWVELLNPGDCTLEVPVGLRILSPRGTVNDVATVTTAFSLPPKGQFLAGGAGAPGHAEWPTIRWTTADTMKNTGDTVRVEYGEAAAPIVVDAVTYPSFTNLFAARSIAFPNDCAPEARASFANWSGSFADYPPGPLTGTPFAPNDDVTCAPLP